VNHPTSLTTDTVENATIALLEADTIDAIANILLEICLARADGARGAVLAGNEAPLTVAAIRPDENARSDEPQTIRRSELSERALSLLPPDNEVASMTVDLTSLFDGDTAVTALVMPLRQRSETVGILYIEYDDGRSYFDPQTIGALSMFSRQAAASIVRLCLSEDLEREVDRRRSAEESRKEIYDLIIKHQRIGKMGDFRFNTRTLRSRGSAQCYTIFGYEQGTDIVEYDLWMDKLHPDDRQRVHEEMHAAFAKQLPLRFEYRVVVDGETRHILSEGHPEFEKNGDLLYCGVVVDITEQKAVEEVFANMQSELSAAMRLASLGELAGSVVHEVNQPLTAMIANADACRRWLCRTPADIVEAREAADQVSQEARRAAAVVFGLEALAKGAQTHFTKVRMQDVVDEVLLLLKPHLDRAKISTQVDLQDDLTEIVGDRMQLQQVVFNLVRNAADAMKAVHDRVRSLRISGWVTEDDMTISFKDSGEGVEPERLEGMFAPLFTTKAEGLGLGLSICKRIISAHRGKIVAERNNDEGLIVSFSIPRDFVAGRRLDVTQ
jgi:PAS domain S-box-containing protein